MLLSFKTRTPESLAQTCSPVGRVGRLPRWSLPGSSDARENLAAHLLRPGQEDPARALELLEGVLAEEPARDRALYLRHVATRAGAR